MSAKHFPFENKEQKALPNPHEQAEHSLVTPLTGIRAMAEILRDVDDITPEERRRFASAILEDERRLEKAVLDYLR